MKLVKLNEDIYYMENVDKSDRPVLSYVKGSNYSIIIDCGNSRKHLKTFLDLILEEGFEYPKYAILTHWHWDHSFGMAEFKNEVIASSLTNKKLNEQLLFSWEEEEVLRRLETGEEIEFAYNAMKEEYKNLNEIEVKLADIIFEDYLELNLGNKTVEIKRVGGPHEEDSCLIYVEEDKVLFAGDAHSGDYYNNNGEISKAKMAEYLDVLRSIDFKTYVPGHNAPVAKEDIINALSRFI